MQLFIGEINGNIAQLSGDEFLHFTKVLRGNVGQRIFVTDGFGNLAQGIVMQIFSKYLEVEIDDLQSNFEQRNYRLHVAIAPTKNMDRIEFFLEKATEIGIDEITFLKTFHSERKNINLDRCQKIVNSAVKQSLKAYVPIINDLVKFDDFIKQKHDSNKLIAHCSSEFDRININKIIKENERFLLMIGPEGDFSETEIRDAIQLGFDSVSLGSQRFRTETAAICAVLSVNLLLN